MPGVSAEQTASSSAGDRWLIGLLSALAVLFGSLAIAILRFKHFTIDEFQYAHAAWLVAHRQIPYRDFFNDRFPLLYQALGAVPALKTAEPEDIILLRWMMLPLLAVTVVIHALMNRHGGRVIAILGVVILLGTSTFTARATEIRPDPLAFALFLAAITVLSGEYFADRMAAFIAGLLVAASLWASLKVVYYGCIFVVALLLDIFFNRPKRRERFLRQDSMFLAGFAIVAALIGTYLWLSGSMSDWFNWSVKWAYVHEAHYPRVPWIRTSAPFLRDYWWIVVLGAVGWLIDLSREVRSRQADRREMLLLLALPSTLLSFAAQRAPFEYSLIPFIGILTIYASRGLVLLFGAVHRLRPTLRAVAMPILIVACGCGAILSFVRSRQAMWPRLDGQLATLHQLGVVTGSTDAIYDNTGAYFARPHAWYFFYTDELLRRRLSATMTADVEQALLRSQAPAVLIDLRFKGLPPELQRFIEEHYQPYGGDLCLWGMRFGPAPAIDGQFWAIQNGAYFIDPVEVLQRGTLTIGGHRITSQVFTLPLGENRVAYTGRPSAFSILWLPRDRKPYAPTVSPLRSLFSFL